MGIDVGMGGAVLGMGMMWFGSLFSSAPGTTNTTSNGVLDVDDDTGDDFSSPNSKPLGHVRLLSHRISDRC